MLKIKFVDRVEDMEIFRNRGARIVASVIAKTDELMFRLQSQIVQTKLSGDPLHRRTGTLAGSVTVVPAEVRGDKLTGAVEAAGGPAWYGKVHETGGLHPFDVLPTRKRVLRFMVDGQTIFARIAHREPLPARPFAEPSLDEMREQIVQGIQAAFDRALND